MAQVPNAECMSEEYLQEIINFSAFFAPGHKLSFIKTD